MSYYECQRCLFISKQKTGMIRHLERKNKCIKNVQAYKFTDEQLYHKSLVMIKKEEKINFNQLQLTFELPPKKKNKCKFCLKYFSTKGNLNKHILKHENGSIPVYPMEYYQNGTEKNKQNEEEPKTNQQSYTQNIHTNTFIQSDNMMENIEFIKKQIEESQKNNVYCTTETANIQVSDEDNESSNKQNINQTINNITVNQQFNNFNIINVKYPNSFDNDWDLSKISDEKKNFLINCCNTKYSELLKTILQNEDNLNVIIEKETNTGIVYKNDTEKYIQLDKSDIIDQSLIKLNNQLNNLCQEIYMKNEGTDMVEKLQYESLNINKKFNDYRTNNNNIRSRVQDVLLNIFNQKKDKTIEMMNKIIEDETNNNLLKKNGF